MKVRHYQISEDDLAVLEDSLPILYREGSDNTVLNQRADLREAWKMAKEILSNVRWGYGPSDRVETIGESDP